MRGTGDKIENKFIIPIARELAIALKAIHDGGIIHRDVKGTFLCHKVNVNSAEKAFANTTLTQGVFLQRRMS